MTAVVLHALDMQFPLKLRSVILYYHTCNPGSEESNPQASTQCPAKCL